MKELSIEEKARRYDEAFEKLRRLHDNYDTVSTLIDIKEELENIFPELKESEDEKIRQLLLRFVKYDMSDNYSDDFTPADCIAWLEKQAEQKPILSMPVFKEGDILYNKDSFASDSIFIFKGISKTNVYLCYARLYGEKDFCVYSKENWDKGVGIYGGEFYPANHKQKELLFSKMEESGYRWNPDQKKMEKIEQKPADNVEQKGMNIDEESMTPFQKKVFCIIDTAIEEEQGLKQVCDELLALASNEIEQKPVVDDKDAEKASEEYRNFRMSCGIKDPVMLNEIEEAFYEGAIRKQKPVWSEEDKRNIERCITKIEIDKQNWEKNGNANTKTMVDADNELISWLKSLKDRVQPQPKREWSEEDDSCIRYLIECLEVCAKGTSLKMVTSTAQKYVEWLKSIKGKYTWKPSEEQMKALNEAIYHVDDSVAIQLSVLIGDLKK